MPYFINRNSQLPITLQLPFECAKSISIKLILSISQEKTKPQYLLHRHSVLDQYVKIERTSPQIAFSDKTNSPEDISVLQNYWGSGVI